MFRKLCIFLQVIFILGSNAQNYQLLTTDQGLSNNSITYIYKDSRGFIWIGTTDGLNRYDGNSFIVYRHNPLNQNSISDNFISSIIEDYEGNIWIGTQGGGLNRYDPYEEKFMALYHDPDNVNSLPSNYIFHHGSLFVDEDSVLWIGTDNGLCSFDLTINKFKRHPISDYDSDDFKDIKVIFRDSRNFLWLGTNSGLIKYSPESGKTRIYIHNSTDRNSLSNNIITSISENNNLYQLWVGTEYGLNIFDVNSETFSQYYSTDSRKNTVSDNSITSITKDENGCMWIGTKSGGLNKYNMDNHSFSYFQHNLSSTENISDNFIECVYYDNKGLLWLGTINAGLNVLDINKKQFELMRNNPASTNSLSYNTIRSIYEDKEGILWIGTYGGGLNRYDGKKFIHFLHQSDEMNSLSHNIVTSFFEDENDMLWIGTWGGGLNFLDKKTLKIRHSSLKLNEFINDITRDNNGIIWIGSNKGVYLYDPDKNEIIKSSINDHLTSLSINKIIQDRNGTIWIATWNGLNCITLKENSYEVVKSEHYKKDLTNKIRLSENRIITLYEGQGNVIWVGTYGGGVNKLSIKNNDAQDNLEVEYYTTEHGLPGNIVYGILEDERKNLWISTNNGLSKFGLQDERFHNFDVNDGLQGNQFYWNAYMKSHSGKMYFGGINGLNIFNPDSIYIKDTYPKVNITNLLLFNKMVPVGERDEGKQVLSKSITYTKKIELARKDYAFTLEFAALTYKSQSKIKYAYKLEGFDNNWIQTNAKKRFATYSHIRPGNYTFKVKSTNADGEWNDDYTSLDIRILPAIYETIWAFIFYSFILIILLINFRNQILSRARYKHEIQLERIERENQEAYNDLKLQFFTNISHEFKTPLTLILGPLENVLSRKDLDKNLKEQLLLMQSGSKRMYRLINQLMEFRKVETGNYKIKISYNDIIPLIKEIVMSFKPKSVQNKIKYILQISLKSANVWFDENVIETIIYNLLSNAFKYTPKKGEIKITVSFYDEKNSNEIHNSEQIKKMLLTISDSGIGISKQRIENIFKRFYQVETFSDKKRGTGIGLALTKDLVEVHKGTIDVESEEGRGTVFLVQIPVNKEFFTEDEIRVSSENGFTQELRDNQEIYEEILINNNPDSINFSISKDKNAPVILLIEDDIELLGYLGKMLEKDYRLMVANNGKEGLKLAIEGEPDLVISDIMMPEMNGLELCEQLKKDIRTSHIPVILLTALSNTDDMIKGYSTGADEYIPKPFHQELVMARIENIIEQRKQLQISFQNKLHQISGKNNVSNVDDKFLKKVMNFLEENIAEPNLNVEKLGKEFGISTTHLYRKIKSLTGLSTNELIRKVRLKKASELLSSGTGNVSQVMYEVGFSNHSYFAKCFQEEFGQTPKEFLTKD